MPHDGRRGSYGRVILRTSNKMWGRGLHHPQPPRSLPWALHIFSTFEQEHGALQDGQYSSLLCSCLTVFDGGVKASGMCIHGVKHIDMFSFLSCRESLLVRRKSSMQ